MLDSHKVIKLIKHLEFCKKLDLFSSHRQQRTHCPTYCPPRSLTSVEIAEKGSSD